MTAPPYAVLEAARVQAGLTLAQLWIDYFALGGTEAPAAMRDFLEGGGGSRVLADYDVVAQALNEHFHSRGEDHPVPYREEL